MRKYYCPYCGEKHLDRGLKIPRRRYMSFDMECHKFDKRVALKCHKFVWLTLPLFILFCLLGMIVAKYSRIFCLVFLIIGILCSFSTRISCIFLSKFVKEDESGKVIFDYKGTMEFADDFKRPKLHFIQESVVVLATKDGRVPVRIEPIEIKEQSGKFEFNCVLYEHNKKINTKAKNLKVLDGEKTIGWMTLENQNEKAE